MKFYVKYDCGFDENDGDECKNDGTLYHPFEGGDWIVDNTKIEDMKLLAIIFCFSIERQGGDDGQEKGLDYSNVSYDDAVKKTMEDPFLRKIGCTDEEIDRAIRNFSMSDYFPSPHSMCAEPHDYWFNMSIVPVEADNYFLNYDFIEKSIKESQK